MLYLLLNAFLMKHLMLNAFLVSLSLLLILCGQSFFVNIGYVEFLEGF